MPDEKKSNPHEGHRERLKRRFAEEGLEKFAPHEVLELLLFYSNPRSDTNPIAHELIDTFGSLSRVFEAGIQELCKVRGISMHSATLLSMIAPLTRAYQKDLLGEKPVLDSSREAGEFAQSICRGRENEIVLVICLDKAKRVIHWKILNEGGLDSTPVYPRMIAKEALMQKAWGVILAHNHPSGVLKASMNDKVMTGKIAEALDTVDVRLIDHIITTAGGFLSMGDLGLIR
jgi:DNA repair protein RadC